MTLVGRDAECGAADQLLRQAREGTSASLVLRGEPGIGKSAILDYAVHASSPRPGSAFASGMSSRSRS